MAVGRQSRHVVSRCAALMALTVAYAAPLHAQTALPAKPVVIVVANAAGGPGDFVGRMIAPKLGEVLKQNVIVDNRPSANGVVASEYAARAVPDGSVLAVGNTGTHAINATLYKKPSYDPVKDFAPVINVISSGLVLVAHPGVPAANFKELLAYGRKNPGKLNIAVAGATGEIAGNAIKMMTGMDMNNVPYKGGAPAVIAVVSGESQLLLTNLSGVATQAEAGKLKILGVTSAKRDPMLPNVATLAESGLEGYDIVMWYGVFAPAKTPAATVQAFNREIARIVDHPDVRGKFTAAGYEVLGGSSEQFGEVVRRDVDRYRKIILGSGMQQQD